MGILVITNRFELGLLDESITKARGLAISKPEMQDAQLLFEEYTRRPHHSACVEMHTDGTYENEQQNTHYQKVLEELSHGNYSLVKPMIHWGSYIFQEEDHIMVIEISYPLFSEEIFLQTKHAKIYLLSF